MQFKKKFTTNYSSILSKPSQILQSEKKRTDLIIDDQRRSNHLVSYETLNSIIGNCNFWNRANSSFSSITLFFLIKVITI